MLSLYVFAGCVFAATYATAIEYRSRAKTHDPQFNVHVRPKFVEIHKGDSLTIKCRAKGGYKLSDIPMISFYVSVYNYMATCFFCNTHPSLVISPFVRVHKESSPIISPFISVYCYYKVKVDDMRSLHKYLG